MKVLKVYPPNYPELVKTFPYIKGRQGILYAWGDKLYAPKLKDPIPPWLMDHEEVHGKRMAYNPDWWWRQYIANPDFRLDEEIYAHREEWRSYKRHHSAASYDKLREYLAMLASRLSGPLYGNLIDRDYALEVITRKEWP